MIPHNLGHSSIGMLYWTALSVKFLPSYSELMKSPHSQQVGIFGVHNFMEIDGMSHTFLGNSSTVGENTNLSFYTLVSVLNCLNDDLSDFQNISSFDKCFPLFLCHSSKTG